MAPTQVWIARDAPVTAPTGGKPPSQRKEERSIRPLFRRIVTSLIALSILFASFLISADSGWCAGIRVENMANVELGDRAPSSERLFEGFENLMPFRVNDILLVSS